MQPLYNFRLKTSLKQMGRQAQGLREKVAYYSSSLCKPMLQDITDKPNLDWSALRVTHPKATTGTSIEVCV